MKEEKSGRARVLYCDVSYSLYILVLYLLRYAVAIVVGDWVDLSLLFYRSLSAWSCEVFLRQLKIFIQPVRH